MCECGLGVPKDEVEGVKWLRLAAVQGNAAGQDNLGADYATGIGGLTADRTEAFKWFLRSARQNYAGGQLNLGVCYANGWGVAQDKDEAYRWYEKAAAQGMEKAKDYMENIRVFRGGQGGRPNATEESHF